MRLTIARLMPHRRPKPSSAQMQVGPRWPLESWTVAIVQDVWDMWAEMQYARMMFGYAAVHVTYAPGSEHLRWLVGVLVQCC